MPRRTSTPAPGARSPGCRRSHDPWRKVGGIRPRTPRRRLPQRSRLLPASKGPTRSIFGLSCPRPPSSPRQTDGGADQHGGGIFRTPAVIAERVPAPLPMFSVWVLGGLLALCGALTYAELAALLPRSG